MEINQRKRMKFWMRMLMMVLEGVALHSGAEPESGVPRVDCIGDVLLWDTFVLIQHRAAEAIECRVTSGKDTLLQISP